MQYETDNPGENAEVQLSCGTEFFSSGGRAGCDPRHSAGSLFGSPAAATVGQVGERSVPPERGSHAHAWLE